jgi:hypothetical protein
VQERPHCLVEGLDALDVRQMRRIELDQPRARNRIGQPVTVRRRRRDVVRANDDERGHGDGGRERPQIASRSAAQQPT